MDRALVALAALVLSLHLGQHIAEDMLSPGWFFALGISGAIALWAAMAAWPRLSEDARTLALAVLGLGLAWGGLARHAADAASDGLTVTHGTGIVAGALGVALLALAATRVARASG